MCEWAFEVGRSVGRSSVVNIHTSYTDLIYSSFATLYSLPPLRGTGVGNRVSACMTGVRRGVFTCVGWQVTLCDPIWQVTSRIALRWGSLYWPSECFSTVVSCYSSNHSVTTQRQKRSPNSSHRHWSQLAIRSVICRWQSMTSQLWVMQSPIFLYLWHSLHVSPHLRPSVCLCGCLCVCCDWSYLTRQLSQSQLSVAESN